MTPLAQIAIEFCRECLGWDIRKATVKGVYAVDGRQLLYCDLSAVIRAVREWCDNRGLWIEIHSYVGSRWQVELGSHGQRHWVVSLDRESLSEALLAASVTAIRKLKTA